MVTKEKKEKIERIYEKLREEFLKDIQDVHDGILDVLYELDTIYLRVQRGYSVQWPQYDLGHEFLGRLWDLEIPVKVED